MSRNILAYADEYGNNSFDFSSQGTHFIVASIIINEEEKDIIESQIEVIRKRYFQTGEIKSKKVGENHKRRLLILKELGQINFSIYALVTDKEKLYGEGFKYKEVFYKYLNGVLYKELYKAYPSLKLNVDEHGSNDFLRSFKKYVQKNHIRDLFEGSDFQTGDSKDSNIIQLADFVAGSLSRCFDRTKDLTCKEQILEVLTPRLSGINYFPKNYEQIQAEETITDQYDSQISTYGVNLALDFIDRKDPRNQEEIDQINCLKLLLLHHNTFGQKKYLSAKELINHLQIGRNNPLKDQQFRSTIIGKLRDEGLLIASSSKGDKKGYRLPTSARDLTKFLEHGNSLIIPILNRINICRERVKLATNNELDILNSDQFKKLLRLLENSAK
jgi:hypothetical protein